MATKQANKRLTKEYLAIQKNPIPYIIAKPLEKNILEWHYVITGPEDSPYQGGEYHGKLLFPPEYPFKPPGIKMLTPSGRFKPDYKICLSMSDFHPDSWNPAWSIATILTGLLSFMLEETETTGSIVTSLQNKQFLALQSMEWNRNRPIFREVFPELLSIPVPKKMPVVAAPRPRTTKTEPAASNVGTSVSIKWFLMMVPGVIVYLILLKLSSRV